MYAKTESMIDLLYEFTTRQWKFENSNMRTLWSSLRSEDRDTFYFSLENFDWKPYLKSYYYGIRKHVLHEDPSNTEEAKRKNRKYGFTLVYTVFFFYSILKSCIVFRLFWLHYLCIFLIICTVFQLCWIFKNIKL